MPEKDITGLLYSWRTKDVSPLRPPQDIRSFKVALLCGPVPKNDLFRHGLQSSFFQHFLDLSQRPYIKLAFLTFGVCVSRRVEPARRVPQVSQNIADSFFHHLQVSGFASDLPEVKPKSCQQSIVIKHLLKMRHQPLAIHAVASEAAPEMVIDAPRRHAVKAVLHHLQQIGIASAPVDAQKQLQIHSLRKLRRHPETAPGRVITRPQGHHSIINQIANETVCENRGVRTRACGTAIKLGSIRGSDTASESIRACCPAPPQFLSFQRPAHSLRDLLRLLHKLRSLLPPSLSHPSHDLPKRRHTLTRLRRKICAAKKRMPLRSKKHSHRPPPMPRHSSSRLHINGIHIRPLLPIHLHINKKSIHLPSSNRILKRLMSHNMTPMTSRIPHRQQHRPIQLPSRRKSLLPPRKPFHRIPSMLSQIRTTLSRQPIHNPLTIPKFPTLPQKPSVSSPTQLHPHPPKHPPIPKKPSATKLKPPSTPSPLAKGSPKITSQAGDGMSFLAALAVEPQSPLSKRVASSQKRYAVACQPHPLT